MGIGTPPSGANVPANTVTAGMAAGVVARDQRLGHRGRACAPGRAPGSPVALCLACASVLPLALTRLRSSALSLSRCSSVSSLDPTASTSSAAESPTLAIVSSPRDAFQIAIVSVAPTRQVAPNVRNHE